jgi:hypothetical protein
VSSGKLTPIAGSPFAAGKQPSSVIVVQTWVYVANAGDNTVSAFTWNQTSGELPGGQQAGSSRDGYDGSITLSDRHAALRRKSELEQRQRICYRE